MTPESTCQYLFETMTYGVVFQDSNGFITHANAAAEHVLGLSLDQLQGRTSIDPRWRAVHPDGSDFPGETHPAIEALRTGKAVRDVIMGIYNPERDEYRWLRVDAVPLIPPGTCRPESVYAVFADITEERRAQEAETESLRQVQEKAQEIVTIFESMIEAFIAFDRTWNVTYVNGEGEKLLRCPRAELLGRNFWKAFPDAVGSRFHVQFEKAVSEAVPVAFEEFYPRLNKWFEIRAYPTPAGLSVYFRDRTARRNAEIERERLLAELNETHMRHRRITREILSSVTEGRLVLCDSASDLPAALPLFAEPIVLTRPTLRDLRKRAVLAARTADFSETRALDLEIAVGEAAMNAVVHADNGVGVVRVDPDAGRVQVWIEDAGAGISDHEIHRVTLFKGYSLKNSLGHGFWLMLQTCDRFYLLTGKQGTTVVIEQARTATEMPWSLIDL